MSRKTAMDALFSAKPASQLGTPNSAPDAPAPPRVRSGAIAAMGASLQQLTESAKVADQVEAGSAIVELDTSLIEGSFVADRIADATDPSLTSLMESIRESGQQVPILVRPHPDKKGHYQVAYGHRRVKAASQLGLPVRAVVRTLSDPELVVAQGKENLDRRDLSFIEKAFFALHLERLKFDRAVIIRALSTDKADLSRYLGVAKSIPEQIAQSIGPAPKAGRARWMALSEALATTGALKRAEKAVNAPGFDEADSDTRFAKVLSAAAAPRERPAVSTWKSRTGRASAKVSQTSKGASLTLDAGSDPEFAEFVLSKLDELHSAFQAKSSDTSDESDQR